MQGPTPLCAAGLRNGGWGEQWGVPAPAGLLGSHQESGLYPAAWEGSQKKRAWV